MSAPEHRSTRFQEELADIVGRRQSSLDEGARAQMFEALSSLERRALIGGAPDGTLRDIAEARFLTGILRNAVRPVRSATLRTVRRAASTGRPVEVAGTMEFDRL